ncbi:MAG: pyridoxamine 5'-phosphate oxidase family protein [Solobacterium sp.]|nr:pyridoxamine 5'-phosphate oxidase family protein [Solobacterium sp.]MBQ6591933.1 pyridoxamine 5'-phosphate oxidase family protein [Solobacterium sp.]MBR0477990.1 pyridoxamine 5'-phosphate oxidase family protein [Solobacterium sp.]MBR2727921.1 pyridoxamine 5'-phosphate oxidase family protein [Solobacterium sp.]
MERVCQFLKDAGTYFLATVEGDQPRVRPFGTIHIYNGKLYIQTGNVKPVAKQLKANPKAEICAFLNGDWIRVTGELVEDDTEEERIKAQESMLEAYPSLAHMYKPGDGNTAVYYFKNATATFSSFTKAPETYTF